MSVKRRDSKKRILRTGESQRNDGRYVFKYTDLTGKSQFVYSWKLEKTDPLPAGKRDCISLREKEAQIMKDLSDGIIPRGGEMTVLQLVEKYLRTRSPKKPNTRKHYMVVYNLLKKESFAYQRIDCVKLSDAKEFCTKLYEKDGRSYSTIKNACSILRPAFQLAVDDDYLRKNPFEFKLHKVVPKVSEKREALTEEQMEAYLKYVREDRHYSQYYDAIYILFHTGLRISEFAGLTINDLDMTNRVINIDHQLQRKNEQMYYILDTKSSSGERKIAMTNEVYECFKRILANRNPPKIEPMIDGKCGFLFFTNRGKPKVDRHWEKTFQCILQKYNKTHEEQMPVVTPHVCRHTFCTNMAKQGMNPKNLQYLMGHSNIAVTLNVYTHMEFEDAETEVRRLASNE